MPVVSTATSTAPPRALESLGRLAPPLGAVAAGAGPVVLLGFSQGGYPVQVVAGYGVALWWLLLVGILTGAIPRPRPTTVGWVALAAITLLSLWGGVSLTWSADPERGLTEVSRAIVAGGSLLLGLSAVRAGQGRALAGGVLAGLSIVVGAAVLSRLSPGLVPGAAETGAFLPSTRTRLSWPLNYWNTIAAAAAMAIPLGLALATRARSPWLSGLAVAPVPLLALGLAYTLSRGGILALAVGLLAAVALIAPRPVLIRTLIAPAIASAIVLKIGLGSDALTDVLGGAAQTDAGRRTLVVAVLASLGTFLVQSGLASADAAHWTPRIPRASRRGFLALVAACAVAAIAVGIAIDVPDRVQDGWARFQEPVSATVNVDERNSAARLGSISSNGRYEMWTAATDAFEAHPLQGIGLGSWESWWNPRREDAGFVRNAHSQFFELLAETGAIGALLFVVLLGAPLAAAGAAAIRRRPELGDAALVGPPVAAFAVGVLVDWHWQITALVVAAMTLAAVALGRGERPDATPPPTRPRWRAAVQAVGLAAVAVGSIAVLAVALVAPQAVDASRDAAARGDLAAAARSADDGAAAVSFAASPVLQRAIVAEQAGDLRAASDAATEAARRTPDDWRPWFVIARVATAQGDHARAVRAFREARRLNPHSSLLR
ncbi:MAG: O-antigen ligase family protein [Patulibacter sp.]|nr:O-antigen ligase family protein [Patulibacter sp.]